MAQTRRRRQTKHRGNAAGVVESRGRTGRKPTAAERDPKVRAKPTRADRRDKPPTWKSAMVKAPIMALLLFLFSVVIFHNTASAAVIVPFALVLYIPLGYYTDRWAYRRRQRQKLAKATRTGR